MYRSIIKLPVDDFYLNGDIELPVQAKSLVIFSHGSGSSRFSPRNKVVAHELHKAGFGTLLFGLLGEHEQDNYHKRFDIDMLTRRLVCITTWINNHSEYKAFDLGYFGSGTGAAPALNASAKLAEVIKAVVSRGGRTDLVHVELIPKIKCPVLLIAGELDFHTLRLNRVLLKKLNGPKQLMVVPGGSHLLEEPDKLDKVAQATATWFGKYLQKSKARTEPDYDLPDERYP